jgi:hypothetical protein
VAIFISIFDFTKKKKMLKILLSLGILTVLSSLTLVYKIFLFKTQANGQNPEIIFPDKIELLNGDLIFRRGRSIESRIVLISDSDSEYSHVGLICYRSGEPFVVHSVPAENGEATELLKMEHIDDFLSEDKATRFAVYRLKDSLKRAAFIASEYAYNCYFREYHFDNQYDLSSDKNLYCTELIWKAYKKAGIDLVQNRFLKINFTFISKAVIMPSSIMKSKHLKLIYSN